MIWDLSPSSVNLNDILTWLDYQSSLSEYEKDAWHQLYLIYLMCILISGLVMKHSWWLIWEAVTGQNIESSKRKRTLKWINTNHKVSYIDVSFQDKCQLALLYGSVLKEVWQLALLCDFSKQREATNGVLKWSQSRCLNCRHINYKNYKSI